MIRSPIEPPREEFGAEEKAFNRRGVLLAAVGALLIALAVLDGWPAV